MSWIHYFLLAIVLLFVFQGIYYLFNKKYILSEILYCPQLLLFFLQV